MSRPVVGLGLTTVPSVFVNLELPMPQRAASLLKLQFPLHLLPTVRGPP